MATQKTCIRASTLGRPAIATANRRATVAKDFYLKAARKQADALRAAKADLLSQLESHRQYGDAVAAAETVQAWLIWLPPSKTLTRWSISITPANSHRRRKARK